MDDSSDNKYIQQLVEAEDAGRLEELLGSRLDFGETVLDYSVSALLLPPRRACRCGAGTAGLRGQMGPGFSRMNRVTVQQTAQGLCRYLQQHDAEDMRQGGIIIGWLASHMQLVELAQAGAWGA